MMLSVAHHHGFKCAGSTVVHLLNRNWPQRVLHIESRVADRRISSAQVREFVTADHMALTSHLLAMPQAGEELAHVHLGLVRDPIARLLSAYKFVPPKRRSGGFAAFVEENEHHACNFHTRQLTALLDGWQVRLDAVPLGAERVLIGLVERFGDSMFLLEQRLRKVGVAFDGSTSAAHNVGSGEGPDLGEHGMAELRARNAVDYELYERVEHALDEELATVDANGDGRIEYGRRCAARAMTPERYAGLGPARWTFVED